MNTRKIGWGVFLTSMLILIIVTGLSSITWPQPMIILISLLLFLGLLSGQLLLVWGYRSHLHKTGLVVWAVGLLFVSFLIYTQPSLANHRLLPIQFLTTINIVWLFSYIFVLGFILALHLYYRDHSVLFIALVLLMLVWANLIFFTRTGSDNFFAHLLNGEMPPLLLTLICLVFWIIPLGIVSFLLHTAKIVNKELNPDRLEKRSKQ